MRLILGALFLATACSTVMTSDQNWISYQNYRKKFYDYTRSPIKSFQCTFESPSLSDTLTKVAAPLKLKAQTLGLVRYEKAKGDIYLDLPSLRGNAKGYWSSGDMKNFIADQGDTPIERGANLQSMGVGILIAQLIRGQLMSPNKDQFFIQEISDSDMESRLVIKQGSSEVSSRLSGITLTEKTTVNKNRIDSRINYVSTKNGLLPVSVIASHTSQLNMLQSQATYEYETIRGWRIPSLITTLTTAEGSGTQVRTRTVIKFSNCSVVD